MCCQRVELLLTVIATLSATRASSSLVLGLEVPQAKTLAEISAVSAMRLT